MKGQRSYCQVGEHRRQQHGLAGNSDTSYYFINALGYTETASTEHKEIFNDRPIKAEPLYGQAKIYIEFAPIADGKRAGAAFREKGAGEYMNRVNRLYLEDFTGIVIVFNNRIGYSNDPFYSGDYETKEKQLEVWAGTPDFRLRRRWHKEFEQWEVQPRFDYAYGIDALYDDTVLPAIRKIIETFRAAYPELPSL